MKTLLVIAGGREAVPGIQTALDMGLRVVVFDGDPAAPGFALAHEQRVVSTYDEDGAVRAARELERVDGVICVAADVPRTVARVAEALELPGPSYETARLATDKLAMKDRFRERGVPIPWYALVADAAELTALRRERDVPLVVKPVDSRGARGVTRLLDPAGAAFAFAAAREHSPSARVMAEEFLPGPQISTETLFVDGTATTVGFADRNYDRLEEFAPFIVEDGATLPSVLPPEVQAEVARVAEEAGRALGLANGVGKGDLVWTGGEARVIEIAARLSGGWFCTDMIPASTGVDLVRQAIRVALGERPTPAELAPRTARGVACRFFFPPAGRVTGHADVEVLRATPGVRRIDLGCSPGDVLLQVVDHTRRPGSVVAEARTRGEAVKIAEEIVHGMSIRTEPVA